MTTDPYADPVSGVLRNNLGIAEEAALTRAEAALSLAALVDIGTRILPGDYDLAHLQAFHREIFGDLYPWTGEIRTVAIAKTDLFCLPQHIESYSAEVFAGLAKEDCLRGLGRPMFVDRVTHYLAEVNAIARCLTSWSRAADRARHVLETRGIKHELCGNEIVVPACGSVINPRLVAVGAS